MRFIVLERDDYVPDSAEPQSCYLKIDNWNDYSYQTLFSLYYANDSREVKSLGEVKITHHGQTIEGRVQLPVSPFDTLNNQYCSLGQSQSYYEEINSLPLAIKNGLLEALRDCVYNPQIYQSFLSEPAFQTSLLRSISEKQIEEKFRSILIGQETFSKYHFQYVLDDYDDCLIDVEVLPGSNPPTNVHVLIGRNGVGKTRILSGIADSLTGNPQIEGSISVQGKVIFLDDGQEKEKFSNLITVVFSAFDLFSPIRNEQIRGDIRYQYVGLKKYIGNVDQQGDVVLKTHEELTSDFASSLKICLSSQRKQRWIEAINILCSDPILYEYNLNALAASTHIGDEIVELFKTLSSGHKIILLSITKLVELVDEKTLILIDEPETHLHPPLLASFMRALSELIKHRNAVAIIATHSPVILQEVPNSCVTIIDRSSTQLQLTRPEIETFAENIGTLTREVFKLEVTQSGYHKVISDFLEHHTYQNLIEDFSDQIGSEGKAIARIISISKDRQDV